MSVCSPMILTEVLLAPTVPSLPSPKNIACGPPGVGTSKVGSDVEREVGDVVDDADREVGHRPVVGQLVEHGLRPSAGVNSFEPRP